jgi:hypothetical protein
VTRQGRRNFIKWAELVVLHASIFGSHSYGNALSLLTAHAFAQIQSGTPGKGGIGGAGFKAGTPGKAGTCSPPCIAKPGQAHNGLPGTNFNGQW